jgi:hypothetical protein
VYHFSPLCNLTPQHGATKLARAYTEIMRVRLLALVASLTFSAALLAQSAPPPLVANGVGQGGEAQIACRAYPKTAQSFKRKLWDGYEISLGPAANASGGGGDDCTAAIYNSQARVVYRTTGFNVTFDENLTGRDFDGDGHPEVVFQTDSGGGNHCCWEYNVISLYPSPHKLFDIDQQGAVEFEVSTATQGKMVIWKRVEAPEIVDSSMADRAFAERVYRVINGKMADSTPEFCPRIFDSESRYDKIWKSVLSPANIADLESVDRPGPDQDDTARALVERAYQHVLCRDYDAAVADLNLWPAPSRTQMKAEFAKQIRDDFPDFAARLVQ